MWVDMDSKISTIAALPDETLDSLLARTFKLCSYSSWSYIRDDVVGPRGRLPGNGIPLRVDSIARFLGGRLSGSEVLRAFTLWNGLTVFMSVDARESLLNRLVAQYYHASGSYELNQLKPRTKQPFRFCDACMDAELNAYGVGYWHRSHQMPLVSSCWLHGNMLRMVHTSRNVHVIRLPQETDQHKPVTQGVVTPDAKRFALISHDVLGCSEPPDIDILPQVYRQRMHSIGLAVGERIHYTQLAGLCSAVQSGLACYAHLGVPSRWLSNILYGHSANPALHLVMITTLFNSWDEFSKTWRDYAPERLIPTVSKRSRQPTADRELRKSLAVPGATVQSVAKSLDWSEDTVRVYARYFAITIPSKKGVISDRAKKAIAAQLSNGDPRQRIARRLRVSLSTIDRIRRSSAAITKARAETIANTQCRGRRDKLQHYLYANPHLRRSDVRSMDRCLYGWLLKNDRAWFEHALQRSASSTRRRENERNKRYGRQPHHESYMGR